MPDASESLELVGVDEFVRDEGFSVGVGFLSINAVAHAHAGGISGRVALALDKAFDEIRDGGGDFGDVKDPYFIGVSDANFIGPLSFFMGELTAETERNFLVVPDPPHCEWQHGEDG